MGPPHRMSRFEEWQHQDFSSGRRHLERTLPNLYARTGLKPRRPPACARSSPGILQAPANSPDTDRLRAREQPIKTRLDVAPSMDHTSTSSTPPITTRSSTRRHAGKTKNLRPNQRTRRYENRTTIITGHSSSTFKHFQKETDNLSDLYNPEEPSPNSPIAAENHVNMTIDLDDDMDTDDAEPSPTPKQIHPPRNPFAPSSVHPLGIDNIGLYDIYNRNSKGEGGRLFNKTDQHQTCLPCPKLTANFDPEIYGNYATTNGAFRQHVSNRYDSIHFSSKSDTGLPPAYIVNSKEQLCLPSFEKTVKLHPKIIPV